MERNYLLSQVKWFFCVEKQIILPLVENANGDGYIDLKKKCVFPKKDFLNKLELAYKCELTEISSYKLISILYDKISMAKIAKNCKDYCFGIPNQQDIENAEYNATKLLSLSKDMEDMLYGEYRRSVAEREL